MFQFAYSIATGASCGEKVRQIASVREKHRTAVSYELFCCTGMILDCMEGKNHAWKQAPGSAYYDHRLLKNRLEQLERLSQIGDLAGIMLLLRGLLIRNFCGISNPNLYTVTHTGTKQLIERYMDEVIHQLLQIYNGGITDGLHKLAASPVPSAVSLAQDLASPIDLLQSMDNILPMSKNISLTELGPGPNMSLHAKLAFFSECLKTFGQTALFFTGGITFGLYHLGLAKALHDQAILPKVICGTSVGGALVASILCTQPSSHALSEFLRDPSSHIKFDVFEKDRRYSGSIRRKIIRFLRHGHLLDIRVIKNFVRDNIGDLTFAEAYQRSNMVLNIIVPSSRKNEPPLLLNYLTTPDVLVWSAACVSGTLPGLYDPVSLYVKSSKGHIVTWHPKELASATAPSTHYHLEEIFGRLSGLFNVNHVILSKIEPWNLSWVRTVFPKTPVPSSAPWMTRLCGFILSEWQHRLAQLHQLHLLPRIFAYYLLDDDVAPKKRSKDRAPGRSFGRASHPPRHGHSSKVAVRPSRSSFMNTSNTQHDMVVTEYLPLISILDLHMILSPLSAKLVQYFIQKGEQATWPLMSRLKNMMRIECLLSNLTDILVQETNLAPHDVSSGPPSPTRALYHSDSRMMSSDRSAEERGNITDALLDPPTDIKWYQPTKEHISRIRDSWSGASET